MSVDNSSSSNNNNSPVDPRIQIELEKLNTATDNINKYEVELDEAKYDFKQLLTESIDKIKLSSHKLSNSIQLAKPYYEARLYAAQLAKESQLAANNHEKAKSIHAAAKEMVYLAEQGLGEQSTLDMACQEMLSHAASRVNQSQMECIDTLNVLKICELKQEVANSRVAKYQSQLKSAIKASSFNIRRTLLQTNLVAYEHELLLLPYYETRANYIGLLKSQKNRMQELEGRVIDSKMTYNEALKNLEKISEEIHKMRRDDEKQNLNTLVVEVDANNSIINDGDDDDDEDGNRIDKHSSKIDSTDEYLDFPSQLSTNASPIHRKKLDHLDCPHLLKDFVSLSTTDDNEQWTEIKLSNSESSSSGYSHQSFQQCETTDKITLGTLGTPTPTSSGSSSDDHNRKITIDDSGKNNCTTPITSIDGVGTPNEPLTNWITRANIKESSSNGQNNQSGRRQSIDILIDASDRVKDVLTSSIQKVGRTLERRNSESEVNQHESPLIINSSAVTTNPSTTYHGLTANDFFSFSRSDHKEGLSDEQVENLQLHEDYFDMVKNVFIDISSK